MTSMYSFSALSLTGETIDLARWRGQVALLVNVASHCGFTPQYEGLQALYRDYHERGFTLLAFPCNQFGRQEPGDADAIASFCANNYAVSFPLFAKIEVNGPQAHPLFKWLERDKPGIFGTRRIKWNFTKFLVGRDGQPIRRYGSRTRPDSLRHAIERALAATPADAETGAKPG